MATRAEIEEALGRAREFMVRHQRPTGEWASYRHLEGADGTVVKREFDSSVFMTMYLALALVDDPTQSVASCVRRAEAFVENEWNTPGVWRFHGRAAPLCAVTACDSDTTAGVLALKRRLGRPVPGTRHLLLENRDRRGRFFTWFTPGNARSASARYWWCVLRDLNLARAFGLWRRTSCRRRDMDVVVNANVVRFLGAEKAAAAAIAWVLEAVRLGEEERRDKWYQSRPALYHAMGRALRDGVRPFGEVRSTIIARLADAAAPNGEIGGSALDTGLSAAALMYFEAFGEVVDRAIWYLLATQGDDGAWPSHPFFYGGWGRRAWWGSRETTTAFAIEALNLYLKHAPGIPDVEGRMIDA